MEKLKTRHLTKAFHGKNVVEDVSLRVEGGEVYGLLGPNGAGKSTLLKMIAGMMHPTSGEILIDEKPWTRSHLSKIGALIETPPIYGNLTARENLKVRALLLNGSDERIDEVLEMVGLSEVGKKKSEKFSLGMKQRLGIALALLNRPELLILDEPTNGLDPLGVESLRGLIRNLSEEGVTVIVSSHILVEVEAVADTIGILYGGRLLHQARADRSRSLEELFMDVVKGGGAF